MRVLVCGGRDFKDCAFISKVMDELHSNTPITCIIHGHARGADLCGHQWALTRSIKSLSFPADWVRHGRAAGFIRNKAMIMQGQPNLVLAFPGGKGTADMIRQTKANKIRLIVVVPDGTATIKKEIKPYDNPKL